MAIRPHPVFLTIIFIALLPGGCQSTEYLMPAPIVITDKIVDPRIVKGKLADSNQVGIFYATNRLPSTSPGSRHYISKFDQTLRLGTARVRIGDEALPADQTFAIAISSERKQALPLRLEQVQEHTAISEQQDLDQVSQSTRSYLDKIKAALADSDDKDITVYVHGANNTFYRSAVQAAQFRYFSSMRPVVLLYSWPSAGSMIHYETDVKNSAQSYKVFARMINLLARHTDARHINILSYSAGARITSPALNLLAQPDGNTSPSDLGRRLRLGIVYYAEPDEYQVQFFHYLARYLAITQTVTLTVNFHDSVLAYAETFRGRARAGMPDPEQLSETDLTQLVKELNQPNFHVIDIDGSHIPGLARGAHNAWYGHPWINADVITQFQFHADPLQRGLVLKIMNRPWERYWVYPPDYPVRLENALPALIRGTGSP